MSERAKLFEALMRHLWCYWLRLPPTNMNFYRGAMEFELPHIAHALILVQLLEAEGEALDADEADLRRREKELLLGPELPPSACSKTDD